MRGGMRALAGDQLEDKESAYDNGKARQSDDDFNPLAAEHRHEGIARLGRCFRFFVRLSHRKKMLSFP